MPQKTKRLMVVMTPAAYQVFEEWLKRHPRYASAFCTKYPTASQQPENKEVSHETGN